MNHVVFIYYLHCILPYTLAYHFFVDVEFFHKVKLIFTIRSKVFYSIRSVLPTPDICCNGIKMVCRDKYKAFTCPVFLFHALGS